MKKTVKKAILIISFLVLLFYSVSLFITGIDTRDIISNLDPVKLASRLMEARKFSDISLTIINEYVDYVDDDKLMEAAYRGMLDSLEDQYSYYYTRDELEQYRMRREGAFGGIGVSVRSDYENLTIEIIDFLGDSPAREAGLLIGDLIISADGTGFDDRDTMSAMFDIIPGEIGTDVEIGIFRPGTGETLSFIITRDKILINNTRREMIDGIGYIQIKSFTSGVSEDFEDALEWLTGQDVSGLIVDVRGNGGGSLDEVIKISDLFLPAGEQKTLIVYVEDKYGKRKEYHAKPGANDLPMVVLTDAGSASASELFSGSIQSNGRGIIIGEKTFGKGIVQTDYYLPDGTGFKITTKKYYLPSGQSPHGIGITPDITIEQSEEYRGLDPEYIPEDKDPVMKKALEHLINK